jgi:hypothetical protein
MFYAWIGSIVVLGGAPILASEFVERAALGWRMAGVAVGIAGFIPWLLMIFVIVKRGDEFVRRLHLIAIAWAAAFGLILLIAVGWLVRASFIDTPDFTFLWLACLVGWSVSLFITKRHFEGAQ